MELKDFLTNNIDIILIIVGVILSFFVIKYVTKILFKIIFTVIVVGFIIIITQMISDTNMIDYLNNRYCIESSTDLSTCECVVKPIISDLKERFSDQEIEDLKKKKILGNTEVIKSYITRKNDIDNCLKTYEKQYSLINDVWNSLLMNTKSSFLEKE